MIQERYSENQKSYCSCKYWFSSSKDHHLEIFVYSCRTKCLSMHNRSLVEIRGEINYFPFCFVTAGQTVTKYE